MSNTSILHSLGKIGLGGISITDERTSTLTTELGLGCAKKLN